MSPYDSGVDRARQRSRDHDDRTDILSVGSLPWLSVPRWRCQPFREIVPWWSVGMIAAVPLALIFVPVFYMLLETGWFSKRNRKL